MDVGLLTIFRTEYNQIDATFPSFYLTADVRKLNSKKGFAGADSN